MLVACLKTLPRLLAPILPHLAEELWQAVPYKQATPYSKERGSTEFSMKWIEFSECWILLGGKMGRKVVLMMDFV